MHVDSLLRMELQVYSQLIASSVAFPLSFSNVRPPRHFMLTSLSQRTFSPCFSSYLSGPRATLRLAQSQDRDVTPGLIDSSFSLNSTQTQSCSSAPSLPLVRPAVGVILQSGTYWPWDSGPTLAPYTSVRAPTSVRRAKILMAIRAIRLLSYSRWSSLWQKLEEGSEA